MSDANLLRIYILIAALVLFVVIIMVGRKQPGQGKRVAGAKADAVSRRDGERHEPSFSEILDSEVDADQADGRMHMETTMQAELELLEQTLAGVPSRVSAAAGASRMLSPELGMRREQQFDKIVTVLLAARAGQTLHGPDLVVAAEKAGLVYGHRGVFHRLVDGKPEVGPIFSVANMVKPGSFDMAQIQQLQTPGISFFMTLPAPLAALDAWETMLPTVERMAELLDAIALDDERNALSRQRIAHIRDELRAYDRQREKQTIQPQW